MINSPPFRRPRIGPSVPMSMPSISLGRIYMVLTSMGHGKEQLQRGGYLECHCYCIVSGWLCRVQSWMSLLGLLRLELTLHQYKYDISAAYIYTHVCTKATWLFPHLMVCCNIYNTHIHTHTHTHTHTNHILPAYTCTAHTRRTQCMKWQSLSFSACRTFKVWSYTCQTYTTSRLISASST